MSDKNANLYWGQSTSCICLKVSVWCPLCHQSNLTVILNRLKSVFCHCVLIHNYFFQTMHPDPNNLSQNAGNDFDCKLIRCKSYMLFNLLLTFYYIEVYLHSSWAWMSHQAPESTTNSISQQHTEHTVTNSISQHTSQIVICCSSPAY